MAITVGKNQSLVDDDDGRRHHDRLCHCHHRKLMKGLQTRWPKTAQSSSRRLKLVKKPLKRAQKGSKWLKTTQNY